MSAAGGNCGGEKGREIGLWNLHTALRTRPISHTHACMFADVRKKVANPSTE